VKQKVCPYCGEKPCTAPLCRERQEKFIREGREKASKQMILRPLSTVQMIGEDNA
jgi:hypothetical protein